MAMAESFQDWATIFSSLAAAAGLSLWGFSYIKIEK